MEGDTGPPQLGLPASVTVLRGKMRKRWKLRGLCVLNQRTQEPCWLQVNYSVTAHWIDAYIKLITAFFHDFSHLINTFCEELSTESSIISQFSLCRFFVRTTATVAAVHEWWQCTSSWLTHYEPLWTWVAAFGGAAGAWHESATEKPPVSDFFFSDILTSQTFFRLYSHRLHLRLVSEESRLYTAEESSFTIIGKEETKKGRSIGHV